jgi:hypothetical protein
MSNFDESNNKNENNQRQPGREEDGQKHLDEGTNATVAAGQCRQFKADGSRCRANAQRSSEFCFFHDPATADERDAARVHGGQERSRKAVVLSGDTPDRQLTNAADVTALLAETINQVRRGEIDAYIANSVGQLSQILLKARQQDEFEQRLAKVESIFASKWVHPKSAVKPIIESDAFEFSEPQSGGRA